MGEEGIQVMKASNYAAKCSHSNYESDIEQVFIIIGKYHNGKIRARTAETMGVNMATALSIAEKNGMEIYYEKKLKTEKFTNDEVMELIKLVIKEHNEYARYRLYDLFGAVFYKFFSKHGNLEPRETKNDRYWNFMAESMIVLNQSINYYWDLYEKGRFKAGKGYQKPVEFSFILRKKLREVPRTIVKETKTIRFGDGVDKNINNLRDFLRKYEQENGDRQPTFQELAEVLHVKKPKVVQQYINDLHKKNI